MCRRRAAKADVNQLRGCALLVSSSSKDVVKELWLVVAYENSSYDNKINSGVSME